MSDPDDRSVYPVGPGVPEHDTTGRACWCRPRVEAECSQCDGDLDCWKCDGEGWTPVEPDHDGRVVVIHNDVRP